MGGGENAPTVSALRATGEQLRLFGIGPLAANCVLDDLHRVFSE
ncbi:hypothetical protein [Bounagaea algeriensis]